VKLVKKEDCIIKNGYVTNGGEVIALPAGVYRCLDKLNYMYQAAEYNKENTPEVRKAPAPFKPKMDYADRHGAAVEAETPALDKAVDEALAIAKDIKKCGTAEKMNDLLEGFKPLILFLTEDEFLPGCDIVGRLGIPADWNIFEWAVGDLIEKLEFIAINGDKPFSADSDGDNLRVIEVINRILSED